MIGIKDIDYVEEVFGIIKILVDKFYKDKEDVVVVVLCEFFR